MEFKFGKALAEAITGKRINRIIMEFKWKRRREKSRRGRRINRIIMEFKLYHHSFLKKGAKNELIES